MKHLSWITLCLIGFIVVSCDSRKEEISVAESRNYFSAYTSGMINADSKIEFRVLNTETIDTTKLKEAIEIKPPIDFDVQWNKARNSFALNPTQTLERGKQYTIYVHLKPIFDTKNNLVISTNIETFKQNVEISNQGLLITEDGQRILTADINTSLSESTNALKSIFNLSPEKVIITADNDTKFNLRISLTKDLVENGISWNASTLGSEDKGKLLLQKYSEQQFEVIQSHFDRATSQYKVYFSKRLSASQEKNGLVLVGGVDAQIDLHNNVLTIYIDNVNQNQDLFISQNLKAENGTKLESNLNYLIEVEMIKPELQWVDQGTYIPNSGEFKVPFRAKGLKSVHVQVIGMPSEEASRFSSWNDISTLDLMEIKRYGRLELNENIKLTGSESLARKWAEYGLDLSEKFTRQNGTIYTILLSFGPANTILKCSSGNLSEFEQSVLTESFFDDPHKYYRSYSYGYNYNERNNPCHQSYYLNREALSKNVHCTNVFPIIKSGEDKLFVGLKELLTNELGAGAQVTALNLQGWPIGQKEVSSEGTCFIEGLEQNPKAIRINYKGQESYFSLDQWNTLSLTEFDISSEVRDVDNRIFVYSERDIRRPGDTIFLNVMLNRSKFDFVENLPLIVQLYNSKDVLVNKAIHPIKNNQSIYAFQWPTSIQSETGFWKAVIKFGPHRKNHSIRVETIKPNVVDLVYNWKHKKEDWITMSSISGSAQINYLAGFPMKNGTLTVDARIQPVNSPFKSLKQYSFTDQHFNPENKNNLIQSSTNNEGMAVFNSTFDFKKFNTACRVILDSKIDLPAGGLNTETEVINVSPFSSYAGISKATGSGWQGSFAYGEKPVISLVHVDQLGELLKSKSNLDVKVYKYSKDWWYDRYQLSRQNNYRNTYRDSLVDQRTVEMNDGKFDYTHNVDQYGSGMFRIVVKDPKSGHRSSYKYHVISNPDYTSNRSPDLLVIKTDKSEYTVGEKMKVQLPIIPQARALITVEVGEKILDAFWMRLNEEWLSLDVKDSWQPNVYLNVSIVQSYGLKDNDLPMRMYGVKKIKVNKNKDGVVPEIRCNDKIEPNSNFTINILEKNKQEMEYTLAVVDQGLLNLTGFKTPDPARHFSKNIALKIKTWDIFTKLMLSTNPSFAGILSIGGDASIDQTLDESADFNRFVPVVYHLGPFQLGRGKTNEHKIQIPNYIGQLRVMVVACDKTSFGHTEKEVRVASPLMVQAQLPRSLNISDSIHIPITLFRDESEIENAELVVKENNGKVELPKNKKSIRFGDEDQLTSSIPLFVGNDAGDAHILIQANSKKHKANEDTKIYINYPNAYSSIDEVLEIPPGESKTIELNSFGYPSTQHLNLNVAGALIPNFVKYYHDLIEYPHGCLEQLTSKGISLLHIQDFVLLSPKEKLNSEDYLDATIHKVQSYQKADGKFAYWPNGYYNVWSDIYAGFFLHVAKEKNKKVSNGVLSKWRTLQTTEANRWSITGTMISKYQERREEEVQAFRLYALARAGIAQKGAMNRFRQRTKLSAISKALLAGAYIEAGLTGIGRDILEQAMQMSYNSGGYFGSRTRNGAIIIAIASRLGDLEALDRQYKNWVNRINERTWLSTHDKGMAFWACSEYFGDKKADTKEIDFEVKSKKYNDRNKMPSDETKRYSWQGQEIDGQAVVSNHGKSILYLNKTQRSISDELYNPGVSQNLNLKVAYTNLNGQSIDISSIPQGEELVMTVSVGNKSGIDLDYLALNVKSPSGWELINPRLLNSSEVKRSKFDFQDYRDDKVYTYFKLAKTGEASTKGFSFRFRAHLNGSFYLPSVTVGDMYNLDVHAQNQARRVRVQ